MGHPTAASVTASLELFGRASGPSVVEGGFAVDYQGDGPTAMLEAGARRLAKLAGGKQIRRQFLTATRYALRRGIQSTCHWLPKSVRHCGSRRIGAEVKIARSGSGHPVWLGVNRCGDPRACPVCSAAVTAQRRDALLAGFDQARELGWSAMAVTLTMRHGMGHDAGKLAELLSKAYRLTFERSTMRKLLKGLGFEGAIRIAETNYSYDNGYHPHLHLVLMFNRTVIELEAEDLGRVLFRQWVLAVNDARIRVGVDVGLPDAEHGVKVQLLDLARGPEYFVKVGLVAELLGQMTKGGRARRSRTMWEVARDMVVNARLGFTAHATEDEAVWRGYVEAMRHFKSFFIATRLRRKLLAPLQLELDIDQGAAPATVVYTFSDDEYGLLCRAGPVAMAAVDTLVEDGRDGAAIAVYLARLLEHLGDRDDLARCRDPVPFRVTEALTVTYSLDDPRSIYGAGPPDCPRMRTLLEPGTGPAVLALFDQLLAAA